MPPASSLRTLLDCAIDYAGLFPPARLDMAAAAERFATYRAGDDAWALGRFVVPVARLDELEAAAATYLAAEESETAPARGKAPRPAPEPWRLSVLAGDDPAADAAAILKFNARHATGQRVDAIVDTVEARASDAAAIERIARAFGDGASGTQLFVELPVISAGGAGDPRPLIEAARACGVRAKVRAGGVTADAFPTPLDLARFVAACAELDVPFKATAGLHHPLRGDYRLTYDDGAPSGAMFGFLAVLLAGAFARDGMAVTDIAHLLEERDPAAFDFDDAGAAWRGVHATTESLARARKEGATSIGSCSFTEPVEELRAMGLL